MLIGASDHWITEILSPVGSSPLLSSVPVINLLVSYLPLQTRLGSLQSTGDIYGTFEIDLLNITIMTSTTQCGENIKGEGEPGDIAS